jgi:hypothetical protein
MTFQVFGYFTADQRQPSIKMKLIDPMTLPTPDQSLSLRIRHACPSSDRPRRGGCGSDFLPSIIMKYMFTALLGLALATSGLGAEPAVTAGSNADETVVLDGNSVWRHFVVSRCAFARTADGKLEPWDLTPFVGSKGRGESSRRYEAGWPSQSPKPATSTESSPLPPKDWTGGEMDDSDWPRVRLPQPAPPVSGRPQNKWGATATLCLRGKFEVKDPAQMKNCRLALDYWGGVVVYLNGKEVVRRNMSGDKPDLLALAEDYPKEAFLTAKGNCATGVDKVIDRGLQSLAIPTALLRRGVNVLAIEVHTAPLPLAYVKVAGDGDRGAGGMLPWMPIGLLRARLTVSAGAAVVPNAARPAGIQVWNSAPYETLGVFDFGDPCENLRPVVIHGARNTAFSGRLVVSSDQPLKGLTVKVSELAEAGGAKFAASAVQVRYAVAVVPGEMLTTEQAGEMVMAQFRHRHTSMVFSQGKSHLPLDRFDGLLETIPAEIPVSRAPVRKSLTGGAVAPLWFTVRVPKNAKAGTYQGQITISAAGLAAVSVPLRVSVSDWVVPEPRDFRLCNLPVQLDYPMAWHYEIPMWSDKHFEMLGKAHALMAEAGARNFNLTLVAEEDRRLAPAVIKTNDYASVIRWIKQPDGKYKHDLTVFDKYLAMVAKSAGMPRPLLLKAWTCTGHNYSKKNIANSPPPNVSVFDPQTGKIETMKAPDPGTDEAVTFWRPVFDDILNRIKERGWLDATALSWTAFYGGPDDSTIRLSEKLWPEAVWFICSHEIHREWRSLNNPAWVKVRYGNTAYFYGEPSARGYRALLEPRPMFLADVFRQNWRDYSPLTLQRRTPEDIAMSGLDGVGDFGSDLFGYRHPSGRFYRSECNDGPSTPAQSHMSMLYPGPDGPVATERYEMFREGVVMTEALLFIERALQAKKLSPKLQQRAEQALDARSNAFIMDWFTIRDMPAAEDGKLLDLAGEVARELGKK